MLFSGEECRWEDGQVVVVGGGGVGGGVLEYIAVSLGPTHSAYSALYSAN